jgi:hypothetical protein
MMEEALKVAAVAVLVGKKSGDEVAGGYRSGELPPALLEPGLYGSELGAPILVVACDLSMHELFVDAASLAAAEPLREPANAAHHQWTTVRTHQARHNPHRDRLSFCSPFLCSNPLRTDRWDAPPRARQRSEVTWSLTDLWVQSQEKQTTTEVFGPKGAAASEKEFKLLRIQEAIRVGNCQLEVNSEWTGADFKSIDARSSSASIRVHRSGYC